jgi:hypothetical protein
MGCRLSRVGCTQWVKITVEFEIYMFFPLLLGGLAGWYGVGPQALFRAMAVCLVALFPDHITYHTHCRFLAGLWLGWVHCVPGGFFGFLFGCGNLRSVNSPLLIYIIRCCSLSWVLLFGYGLGYGHLEWEWYSPWGWLGRRLFTLLPLIILYLSTPRVYAIWSHPCLPDNGHMISVL